MVIIPPEVIKTHLPLQNSSRFYSNKHQQQKPEIPLQSNGYHSNHNGHSNGHIDDFNETPRKKRKLSNGHTEHNGYNGHNGHHEMNSNGHLNHNGYNVHNGHNGHNGHNNKDSKDSKEDLLHIPKKDDKSDDSSVADKCNHHRRTKRSFLEPLIIKIAFTVSEPIDGIHWVVPRYIKDGSPSVSPSLSLSSSKNNSRSPSVTLSSPSKSPTKTNLKKRTWGQMNYDDVNEEQKMKEVSFPDRKPRMLCHVAFLRIFGERMCVSLYDDRYVYL